MPSLNFQQQFADAVASGQKHQTIRAHRKQPIIAGDRVHLFTGMRRPGCQKLGVGVVTRVVPITIGLGFAMDEIRIGHGGAPFLDTGERAQLARTDGFGCASDLVEWFRETHGLPFTGSLIVWDLIR